MIIRIVKMKFLPGRTEEFLSIFNSSHSKIRYFEGCRHLDLVRDIEDSSTFFTISHWESENALDEYRKSELFKSTWNRTKLLFVDKARAWSTQVHNVS